MIIAIHVMMMTMMTMLITITIITITRTVFIVLSSWQSHCESSFGSREQYRTAPSGLWTKSTGLSHEFAYYKLQAAIKPHGRHLLLLLSPDTHSTAPQRVEG